MPPNRSCDNVDEVDELDGEGEGEIQTIRIVNTEKGGKVMCEICSSVLKSAAFTEVMINICAQIVGL